MHCEAKEGPLCDSLCMTGMLISAVVRPGGILMWFYFPSRDSPWHPKILPAIRMLERDIEGALLLAGSGRSGRFGTVYFLLASYGVAQYLAQRRTHPARGMPEIALNFPAEIHIKHDRALYGLVFIGISVEKQCTETR